MKVKVTTWCRNDDDYKAIERYLSGITNVLLGSSMGFILKGEKMAVLSDLTSYIIINSELIRAMKINILENETDF